MLRLQIESPRASLFVPSARPGVVNQPGAESLMTCDTRDGQGLGLPAGSRRMVRVEGAATVDICDPSLEMVHGCGVEVC